MRIDDDREAVLAGEAFALAKHLCRDAFGLAVPKASGHIERVVVVREPDLRRLGRGRVLHGIDLMQIDDGLNCHPDRIVDEAVDDGRGIDAGDLDTLVAAGGAIVRLGENGGRNQRAEHADGA